MDIIRKKNQDIPSKKGAVTVVRGVNFSPKKNLKKRKIYNLPNFFRIFLGFLIFLAIFLSGYFFIQKKITQKNYENGVKKLAEGKFEEAAKELEKVSSGENEIDALYRVAVSKYNQKDFEGAALVYQRVIERNTQHCQSYNGLANLYRDQKNYTLAEKNYQKAVDCDRGYIAAYSNWAIMFSDAGKKAEAERVLNEALEKNPGNSELTKLRGIIFGE